MRGLTDRSDEHYVLGQALMAVLAGILLMIGTVSPVLHIPTLCWCVGGLAVAYGGMLAARTAPQAAATASVGTGMRATYR